MDTEKILYIVSLLVFSWEYLLTYTNITHQQRICHEFCRGPLADWPCFWYWNQPMVGTIPQKRPRNPVVNPMENPVQVNRGQKGTWDERKSWRLCPPDQTKVSLDRSPFWPITMVYHWLVVWNMAFIFPYIGNNNPIWLIFFRGVETTNQITMVYHHGLSVKLAKKLRPLCWLNAGWHQIANYNFFAPTF